MLKSEDIPFGGTAHQRIQCCGQSGGNAVARNVGREHAVAVFLVLTQEQPYGGNGNYAHAAAFLGQSLGGMYGQSDLATVGHEYQFGILGFDDGVSAALCTISGFAAVVVGGRQILKILTRKYQYSRTFLIVHSHLPSYSGFGTIGGTQYQGALAAAEVVEKLHEAYLCFLFHRLVSRSVLAYAEGIVRENVLHRQFHKRRHTQSRFDIVAEDEESAASADTSAMKGDAVDCGGHSQLGHTGL